mmetsp:Transcript_102232/g.284783  ORF Transcript_102232/g.284783 Transcript_102232/m.284783 type:complete len:321 (-) Transcript_102232:203-1165(-)
MGMPVGHLLEVRDALLLDVLRLGDAQLPQERRAERGVHEDRQHGHAADVEHDARAHLAVHRRAEVHVHREDQAHSAAQAAPRHDNDLLPRHPLAATVEERPEHSDHEEPNQRRRKVEDHQQDAITPLQVLPRLAREHALAKEEAGEEENDGVPHELDELPHSVHGLSGHESRPCQIREHAARADDGEHATSLDLVLGQEEAKETTADGHGNLDHRVAVVPGLRGAEDDDERQCAHGNAQEHGHNRHLQEEDDHALGRQGLATPDRLCHFEEDNCCAIIQQALTRDEHRQARGDAQRVEKCHHRNGVGRGQDGAKDKGSCP